MRLPLAGSATRPQLDQLRSLDLWPVPVLMGMLSLT